MSAMTVQDLLTGVVEAPLVLAGRPVERLTLDSREVAANCAFVALAGATTHGLRHADEALARGAACVLYEAPPPADLTLPDAAIEVPALRARLGQIADRFHGHPSARLTVVGVTGTNGKTSTVQLLGQALQTHSSGPAGTLGTLGIGFGGELRGGERTTPDVISVHAALADLRDRGARAVAMEVSSHALDQGRVDAVAFDIAVFTNLTRDHLDYHGDMASYGAAKARLFAWPTLRAAVINRDDAFGRSLVEQLPASLPCWTVSAAGDPGARLRAESIVCSAAGLRFDLCEAGQRMTVSSRLLGRFNVDNLLAVAGCLRALGWPLGDVAAALEGLQPVAGRMNRIDVDQAQPLVVVDYAHTPDALAQALGSLRAHTRGELVCVFGCGGERDRGKRPQMARAVESHADRCVLTDDNPRREDGDGIVADTLAGFEDRSRVRVQRDRAQAIAEAIGSAGEGDTVLIAGKGHEPYQEIGTEKRPFDDAVVARRCLESRA